VIARIWASAGETADVERLTITTDQDDRRKCLAHFDSDGPNASMKSDEIAT